MWSISPKQLILKTNEVHIWKANVTELRTILPYFESVLSIDEKDRAERFKFEKDRLTYVIGKGVLRHLLGCYIDYKPNMIEFSYNKQQKPFINSNSNIQFNISHSKQMLLFGFTLIDDIGVDIEYNKRIVEVPQIINRFFSKKESETLLSLDCELWQTAFYNCWTRKEAFIKAKGGGLSIPLDQFEVSLVPGKKAELQKIAWDLNDIDNWIMQAFIHDDDYTSAVMLNNNSANFSYYNANSIEF